jgi:hypothetical protein
MTTDMAGEVCEPTDAMTVTVTVSAPYTVIAGGWTGMRPVGRRRTYTAEVDGVKIEQTSKPEIQRIIRRKCYPQRVQIIFQESE